MELKEIDRTAELYDLATIIAPQMAKSWYALPNWCYQLGQKKIDIDLNNFTPMYIPIKKRELFKNLFTNKFKLELFIK